MQADIAPSGGGHMGPLDSSSEDYVKGMRIRFREQAARFLEDVSFDVGAVLARDMSLQDEDTKIRLCELQKGLSEQVQHMQNVIKKDKCVLTAASTHKKSSKDMHFTQNELKTLQEIAQNEADDNGVVTTFLRRREEGAARGRYKDFVKKAEAKYFEFRREGRKGKFDFRHIIQDSMKPAASWQKPSKSKKQQKVPRLEMPNKEGTQSGAKPKGTAASAAVATSSTITEPTTAQTTSVPSPSSSSTVSIYTTRLPTRRSPRAVYSTEPQDPLVSSVKLIVEELAETVELLVDFECQPFQTAVPPQYPFHNDIGERPDYDDLLKDQEGVDNRDSIDQSGAAPLAEDVEMVGTTDEAASEPESDREHDTEITPRNEGFVQVKMVELQSLSNRGTNCAKAQGRCDPSISARADDVPFVETAKNELVAEVEGEDEENEVKTIMEKALDDSTLLDSDESIANSEFNINSVIAHSESIPDMPPSQSYLPPVPRLQLARDLQPVRGSHSNSLARLAAPKPRHVEHVHCHGRVNRDPSAIKLNKIVQNKSSKQIDGSRSPWRHPDWYAHTRSQRPKQVKRAPKISPLEHDK